MHPALVMSRMTRTFVSAVEQFADKHQIALVLLRGGFARRTFFTSICSGSSRRMV